MTENMTSVFRKRTYTGLYTNYNSFTSYIYKVGLVRTLIDRVYKINNTWAGFDCDIRNLVVNLQKNGYPIWLINKFVNKRLREPTQNTAIEKSSNKYFKLPYIGYYSRIAQRKINAIAKRYCHEVRVVLVFKTVKLSNMFSTKDKTPLTLRSNVVYKFVCAGCGSSYIGETSRHLKTRIGEHLHNNSSHIFSHLQASNNCRQLVTDECFTIVDQSENNWNLRVKEALYISWIKPDLNRQLHHYRLSLAI